MALLAEAGLLLVGLLGLSFWIRAADLDLSLQRGFFSGVDGWATGRLSVLRLLYDLGPVLAWVLAGLGLVALALSFLRVGWRPRRRAALFLVMHFLLGPGLLVNGILKESIGRPRPRQIEEFGGPRRFVPVLEIGGQGRGTSFPSGHASMGAFLLSPWFLLRRRRGALARLFLGLGLGCGAVLGLTRMLQGGHFLSDVIWALGLVYLTGLLLARVLGLDRDALAPDAPTQVRIDP